MKTKNIFISAFKGHQNFGPWAPELCIAGFKGGVDQSIFQSSTSVQWTINKKLNSSNVGTEFLGYCIIITPPKTGWGENID